MKIRCTRITRDVLALSMVASLVFIPGCGSHHTKSDNSAARSTTTERPDKRSAGRNHSSHRDSVEHSDSSSPGDDYPSHHDESHRDWVAFLQDPANYLLEKGDFPQGYVARTLSLTESGKAIQDVGRAGVSVENFPESCNGAAGRIGTANDRIAIQMASKQNHSLTLVVINSSDPNAAVSTWAQKNNQCPTFLSQENGVTSTVTVENTHSPEVSGAHSVGYLVKTKTTNLRGTTTQEQLLYAVPMGEVVIEVMGMNFGGPVNRREVDEVLQQAVARSSEIHKQATVATEHKKHSASVQ